MIDRASGMGGTDAAATMGVHPFKTRIDLYAQKIGLMPDIEPNWRMRRGIALEPLIREDFAAAHGVKIEVPGSIRSETQPWRFGTPDGLIVDSVPPAGLEIKTAGGEPWIANRWGEEGGDEVPIEYDIQCHWYMDLFDRDIWWLAARIGDEYREYRLLRDKEWEACIIEEAEKFWVDHVLARKPPLIDGSESAGKFLARRWASHSEDMIESCPEDDELIVALLAAKKTREVAEEEEERLKNEFRNRINEHAGISGVGWKATWKKTKDSERVEWEQVAQDLAQQLPPEEIRRAIGAHKKIVEGVRRFVPTFPGTKRRGGRQWQR